MRYGRSDWARRGISPGIRGVAGGKSDLAPAAGNTTFPASPANVARPASDSSQPMAKPDTSEVGDEANKAWPIPRKRFEFSCVFVGIFGCILLISPAYLIFSRFGSQVMEKYSTAPVFHGGMGQTLRFLELVLGLVGVPVIIFLPRSLRADFMWLLGLFMLCLVLLLTKGQDELLLILSGYPALALLALVALDAITGIRPAVPESITFRNWQFFISAAVTILWFLPAGLAVCGKQIAAVVPHGGHWWIHLIIIVAVIGAELAGVLGLLAYFLSFKRWVNIAGRLLGTLGLTMTMGVGLWTALEPGILAWQSDMWIRMELLWFFLIVSGSLLLVWAGLTQRFILIAARLREMEQNTET